MEVTSTYPRLRINKRDRGFPPTPPFALQRMRVIATIQITTTHRHFRDNYFIGWGMMGPTSWPRVGTSRVVATFYSKEEPEWWWWTVPLVAWRTKTTWFATCPYNWRVKRWDFGHLHPHLKKVKQTDFNPSMISK